jgi:predicted dehydrogenase
MAKCIGYAVVGLGEIAQRFVLPAFARAGDISRVVAIVSSDRARAQAIATELRATAYGYDEFHQCIQRGDVNAVHLTLPTAMRCEYAVEAARAGVHVLCEPPMAITADECRRMIRTCQTNRVKLMVAYPGPFQPATQKALELVRGGHLGPLKTFGSDYVLRVDEDDAGRLQHRLGGGTVYHLGSDCINTARSMFGGEPAQVMAMTARTSRRYGGDVDEGAVALIRFPDDRLAHFHTSFGEEPLAGFTLFGEEGWLRLTEAYRPDAAMTLSLVKHGLREDLRFEPGDPFASLLTYFSNAILQDRQPEPSGVEGLQDIRIVEAIYRSSRDGRPVTLPRLGRVETSVGRDAHPGEHRQAG